MTQATLQSPTSSVSGLAFIALVNQALAALSSLNSGSTAPSTSVTGLASNAGLLWHDTANNLIKIRSSADTAWITIGSIDEANGLFQAAAARESVTAISASQSIGATNHFANFAATASLTLTLGHASTLSNGGCAVSVAAVGGAVTLTPAATDSIVAGSVTLAAGASYVLAQGASALAICDGSSKWYLFGIPIPPTPSMRNRLINGDMRIDQRNAGAAYTITAGAALAYTLDRWWVASTGAAVTVKQATTTTAKRMLVTGAAANTGISIGQRIESANSLDLAGQTVSLQIKASSTSLTTLTWAAYYAISSDAFGTLSAPTKTQIATGSWTITAAEATYTAQLSIPAAATTGLEIILTGGSLLAAQTLTLGDMQLETGSVPSAFELIPIDMQLIRCSRYYHRWSGCWYLCLSGTGDYYRHLPVRWPTQMRAAPSVSFTISGGTPGVQGVTAQGADIFTYAGDTTSSPAITAIVASAEI